MNIQEAYDLIDVQVKYKDYYTYYDHGLGQYESEPRIKVGYIFALECHNSRKIFFKINKEPKNGNSFNWDLVGTKNILEVYKEYGDD